LTAVRVPDAADEAMLELARARTGPGANWSGRDLLRLLAL
jgi:hypothetical protein